MTEDGHIVTVLRQADRFFKIRWIRWIRLYSAKIPLYSWGIDWFQSINPKVYIRWIRWILYILYIRMYSSNILLYSSLHFVFFLSESRWLRWLPSLIYISVRTQNFHSPSLLTRINLCLRIASLDESNCVPDLPLCEVFGVPLSLSCSLSHGDSWKTGWKFALLNENFHRLCTSTLQLDSIPRLGCTSTLYPDSPTRLCTSTLYIDSAIRLSLPRLYPDSATRLCNSTLCNSTLYPDSVPRLCNSTLCTSTLYLDSLQLDSIPRLFTPTLHSTPRLCNSTLCTSTLYLDSIIECIRMVHTLLQFN